jgi:hypothetical protein
VKACAQQWFGIELAAVSGSFCGKVCQWQRFGVEPVYGGGSFGGKACQQYCFSVQHIIKNNYETSMKIIVTEIK